MDVHKLLDTVNSSIANANYNLIHIWTTHIIFSWRWWLEIILTFLPWIVWIKIRDKKNTVRLLFIGLTVALVTNFLDVWGMSFNFWHYDWVIFPMAPTYIPWDYSLFPISIMLILQYKPKVNPFIKAVEFALLTAFILEPLFYRLGLYDTPHWKYWYSFIIYIPLYLFFNCIYKSKLFYVYESSQNQV